MTMLTVLTAVILVRGPHPTVKGVLGSSFNVFAARMALF